MRFRSLLAAGALGAVLAGCGPSEPTAPPPDETLVVDDPAQADPNPPAPGFDLEGSDERAIEVADQVMTALGGRRAWDESRFITWNFFGKRFHVWDKRTGELHLEMRDEKTGEAYVVLMNLDTKEGRAFKDGQEIKDPKTLANLLDGCYKAWVNDSYWLLMPYKLKDTGVTLTYEGERPMPDDGRPADVLQLTFSDVGVTPGNKYLVYVDRDTHLVGWWSYFTDASDAKPRISTPWRDWQRYGRILLSGDRGDDRRLTDLGVFDKAPAAMLSTVPAEAPAGPAK